MARWTFALVFVFTTCIEETNQRLDVVEEGFCDASIETQGDSALLTSDEVLTMGPFQVATMDVVLEDTTRKTMANGNKPERPSRILETRIWYPLAQPEGERSATVAGKYGPWPLLIYCHGFMSENRENAECVETLVSHGFVVAAPQFPLTGLGTPGGPNAADVVNQPGDVRFVIDRVLAMAQDPQSPLYGAIETEHIGVMGVSLGALTAILTGYHEGMRDERVKAVVAAAAPGCYMPAGFFGSHKIPILLLHGTSDAILPYSYNGPPIFEAANPPKHFVTIKGGSHAGMASLAKEMLELTGNSDVIGCQALASNQSVKPEALAAMSESFGGKDAASVLAECPALCEVAVEDSHEMMVSRQLRIVYLSAISFLEAYLKNDSAAYGYLMQGLAAEGTDLIVEHVP